MYFLWQYLSVETNIFYLVSRDLDLDFDLLFVKLEFVAAGGISPVRTDPALVLVQIKGMLLLGIFTFYGTLQ